MKPCSAEGLNFCESIEMVHKQEFQDALDRITYIEKKLGIESGV
jgi:hypothetical protein